MPNWISEIKAEQEQLVAKREAEEARALLAAKMLEVDGPKFWTSLVGELRAMAEQLSEIGVRATMSDTSTNLEKAFEVASCQKQHPLPAPDPYKCFYKNGSDRIRCVPLDVARYDLLFEIAHGELVSCPRSK